MIYNASVPKQDAARWSGRAAHCVLPLAANWQRPVVKVVEGFPCRLLLANDRPEMDSSERRTVDAEIAAGNFDASSADGKLKALFGPEIEHARCTGELCPVLFQLIRVMGRVWNTDVQEIEGCNNTIQHISKLAPSMSWMLLSERMMTKKLIALLPTRAAKTENSAECELRHTKAATIVRSEKDRWMQPARVCLGRDAAVLGKHHRRKPDLPIARAWVNLLDCLRAMGLDLKVNMGPSWALLLGGGYWFHSEIWAAYMEAEGGEGALGDAVLHPPLRIERLVDVIGRSVIEGSIDVTDVSV